MERRVRSRAIAIVLDVVIVASAALCLLIALTGGVDYALGFTRLRAHVAWRPLVALIAASAARIALFGIGVEQAATRAFLALLVAAAATYGQHHVRACGGLDSYGYVSASRAIADGTLKQQQPLASLLPFPEAARAAAPLGWVVAADGRSRVPRFPLGMPLVMAAFGVLGPAGPFFVPLVLAFATLPVVYLAGRDAASSIAGLFAAALVAVNPVFFDLAIQPMSDVPAAFWLAAAAWLTLIRQRLPYAAGVCAGMAVLTRPVLLPAVLAMVALSLPAGKRSVVRFAAIVTVFVVSQLLLNQYLYGKVWGSGYGEASHLFQPSRIGTNLVAYVKWLTYVHTPAFWAAWLGALIALRRHAWAWRFSAVAGASALPYLFYILYDDWEALRFVLPGIVLVTVVIAVGFDALLESWLRPAYRSILLVSIAFACAYASHAYVERHRVFDLRRAEAKYPMLGEWLAQHTPERAVVFAALHSGAIRHYSGRETIRWDEVPSGMLAGSVRRLRAAGHATFLAVDVPSEAQPFDARFRDELHALTVMPAGRVREVNVWELHSR